MSEITVTMWTTVDGYVAGTQGEIDWILGDEQLAAYELAAVADRDTLLFGRSTYEDFAGYWPVAASSAEGGFERDHGRNMTATRKVVVSSTLTDPVWAATEVITSLDDIPRLKQESAKGVLIYGSLSLVRQLSDRSLIDEYQLLVHPVALGGGKSLFAGLSSRLALTLVDQESWASGITLLTYRRGGAKG